MSFNLQSYPNFFTRNDKFVSSELKITDNRQPVTDNYLNMIQVSCAIIVNSIGQVLVTQRSPLMPLPLKWEFPGGKIEENETAEDCLIREIKEELNIEIEITGSLPPNDHQYSDKLIRLIPFICRQKDGVIVLKEHADYKWLDVKNLLDLDWAEADVGVVGEFLRKDERNF